MALPPVVVHDLDVPYRTLAPLEANPPLIVDADAVLAEPIAVQSFEAVAWRNPEVVKLLGRVDRKKLGSCTALNLVSRSLIT
jgi:hypothetical protein